MVTAPGSGAEIIPFLKTWVNLPMAIGFTVLYAKVSAWWWTPCTVAPAAAMKAVTMNVQAAYEQLCQQQQVLAAAALQRQA